MSPLWTNIGPLGQRPQSLPFGSGVNARWDNIVAGYKLDETSGVRADVLGTYPLTDNNTVTSAAGKIDNAASFAAGNSEYLSRATTLLPESADRTVSFWFNTSDVTQVKGLMGVGATPQSGTPQWFFRLNGSKLSIYSSINAGGTHNYTNGATGLSNDTWYHVVYTYDHSAQQQLVYLNDSVEITINTAIDGATFEDDNFYLGVAFPGYITTLIDSVHLFNVVKDATWVSGVYNSGSGVEYPD